MNAIWLIAKSVLIEAIRRKEVYVIVLAATLLIGAVMTVDFFSLEGITKFYLDVALKTMSTAAALTVIVLAARQLPREFEKRTIYPMLAKPISRITFLFGKLLGVMLAAGFTFGLLMVIYLVGSVYLGGEIPLLKLVQYFILQMCAMLILATMSFMLSLLSNLDAAITFGVLIYFASSVLTNLLSMPEIYFNTGGVGKVIIVVMNYILPQLTLLDLSERVIHGWAPVELDLLLILMGYALAFSSVFFSVTYVLFRRRAL